MSVATAIGGPGAAQALDERPSGPASDAPEEMPRLTPARGATVISLVALVLANARDIDRDRFFRQLLVYGGIIVAAAPAAVWLLLIVPGFG